jgi:hypothetical protein
VICLGYGYTQSVFATVETQTWLAWRTEDTMVGRQIVAVTVLSLMLGHAASAKVGSATLEEMAEGSEVIAVVDDVKIHSVNEVHIAEATVSKIVKGPSDLKTLYFVASPTWTCDISAAEEGESALVFLHKISDRSAVFDKDLGYDFELPAEGYDPLYQVSHSGRGRMPIREVDGEKYAEIWLGDVRLPKGLETKPGREPEYDFIQDVKLDEILGTLKKIVPKRRG